MNVRDSNITIDRDHFAKQLKMAIKARKLTFEQATRIVCNRLPHELRISKVSLWQYSTGKAFPRNLYVVETLCKTFGLSINGVSENLADLQDSLKVGSSVAEQKISCGLTLMDAGDGLAFVQVAAAIEWDKALEIARILRHDTTSGALASAAS